MEQDKFRIRLPDQESHHARHVLRLMDEARVILFDGNGNWLAAQLHFEKKSECEARALGELQSEPEAQTRLILATAVPKGDRAEWLIEQASQLNVRTVQWLTCDRSQVRPKESGQKMEKWRRLAVESAKQCGRNHLLRIEPSRTIEQVLEMGYAAARRLLWLDPADSASSIYQISQMGLNDRDLIALIGPEGGWSDQERAILQSLVDQRKAVRVRLTSTVLRIETACAAIAAILMSR